MLFHLKISDKMYSVDKNPYYSTSLGFHYYACMYYCISAVCTLYFNKCIACMFFIHEKCCITPSNLKRPIS